MSSRSHYEQLAKNVESASEAFEKAADIVDKLEQELLTLDGAASKFARDQIELSRKLEEAVARRDAFKATFAGSEGEDFYKAGMKSASKEIDELGKALERTEVRLGGLGEKAAGAADALAKAQAGQDAAGKGLAGAEDAQKGAASGGIGAAIDAFTTSLGFLQGQFNALAGTIAPFVQALSPALMEQFNRAMRDLNAVIGQALAPVMRVLVDVVQQVGDVLNPIMKELQPIFAKLAQSLAGLLLPIVENAAAAFTALIPAISLLADALVALTPLLRVFSVVQAGLVEVFKGLMEGLMGSADMKGAMASFKSAMEETAKAMIRAAAHIARAFGVLGFIDGMIKGVERKAAEKVTARGMAAPESVGITDIAGYASQMLTAAFAATDMGGPKEKKTDDWLADIAGDLKTIKDGPVDLWKKLDEMQANFKEWVTNELPTKIINGLKGPTYEKAVGHGEALLAASPLGLLFRR